MLLLLLPLHFTHRLILNLDWSTVCVRCLVLEIDNNLFRFLVPGRVESSSSYERAK